MFPLKPEKPLVSDDWLGVPEFIVAKGLLGADEFELNEVKLNDEEESLPPPKENGVSPFWVCWLGTELAPGKLWDWPKVNPFVG
jgi:hypothetical protein